MRILCILIFVDIISCFNPNSLDYKVVKFRVYSKNPDYDRKLREQRRSKRLKHALPLEDMKLDMMNQSLISGAKRMQKRIFGPRLSQVPGDGGEIPDLAKSTDKYNHVKEYYSSYSTTYFKKNTPTNSTEGTTGSTNTTNANNTDGTSTNNTNTLDNYREFFNDEEKTIKKILKDPNATFGEFEGQKPAVQKPFYKKFEGFQPESKYKIATMKRTLAAYKQDFEEEFEGTQNYCGLRYEAVFSHASPENVEMLRQMEIEVKQGGLSPNNPILEVDVNVDDQIDD
uniref:Uncharacterized protein n=1 Tax=Theileria annulata TaxID=5874 RepID=A0A3B0MMG9_THEAN